MLKAPKLTVDVKGLKETQTVLKRLGSAGPILGGGALFREGERIMGDSKENYVPVDSGNLRSTGHVELPKISGGKVTVELGYGGPAAPYALTVHENQRAGKTGGISPHGKPYKTWAKVGTWKYLETPFKKAVSGMDRRIAKDIWRELDKIF